MQDFAQDIRVAARRLADAVAREMHMVEIKPIKKSEAIMRLIGSTNPETGKPHSASSAEKVVETDSEYMRFLIDWQMAVTQKIIARGEYDAAVVAGRLAAAEVTP